MATYRLASIVITNPIDTPTFAANDVILVRWDDVSNSITVTKNGVSFTTVGANLGNLDEHYKITIGVSSTSDGYSVSGYSFCSGTSLTWFRMINAYPEYPFFEKQTTANSPVCATGGTGAVCDIAFSGPPTIVHSTDKTTGGSITATATSSNGTVRYGLRNYTYAEMTNTSGTFSGLMPGSWTLYAKDANDCTAILNFKILYKPVDTEHYRFSFRSAPLGSLGTPFNGRVRIYEREYAGDLVEIERGDESPYRLLKQRAGDFNNKLIPIHPTGAELVLYSLQDYQFLPLFTQDPKRYRVVYEIEETPVHSGFISPSVYQEDFISVPYTVTFRIGDNVRTLEQELFTDDNGNLLNGSMKLIKVIAFLMKKTGLSLKIKSGINIFETNHTTTAASDPLDQTYIDVACYRRGTDPFTCWEVLEAILKPFGARIYQSNNQWLIEETDRAHEGYAYRIFNADGVYESNGTATVNDVVIDVKGSSYTDRAAMIDEDHLMEVIPAYGTIKITNELNYVGSLIAGGFEKHDLISPESEEVSNANGIFKSEEGFRDWTLRMPSGVSGVSFGRAIVLTDDNSIAIKRLLDADRATTREIARSVGAFYFTPGSWSGNLRNAYIESAAKPYQYGPGGELKLSFEYSTPSNIESVTFMVLRFALKVGSNWLQENGTWGTTEAIYRAYPTPSTKLQKFEAYISLPDVQAVTDTTVQVRIYYYSKDHYDFGMPSATSSASGGTDGISSLKNFPTLNINYDYKLDVRYHKTTGSATNYSRTYAELRISTAVEDIDGGILHPLDHNATSNPKIWWAINPVLENNKTLSTSNANVRDTIFYVDSVAVDSLTNGQEPPREESIQLEISKQINETLEVTLYNADRPTIVNGKNMYNNYFRLANGTPTFLWNRSGLVDYLPLSSILLKVLGSQHSAPTFRVSGTFANEFRRIGIENYIRITKPGANLTATNTEFTTDLSGWEQSAIGESFSWSAGTAQVTLNGSVSSKKIYQPIPHKGGYIQIDVDLSISPAVGNTREDIMWACFYRGSNIVHTEKLRVLPLITSLSDLTFSHKALMPSHITGIGFFFQYISGSGQCVYNVSKFRPDGIALQEVYQIADYQSNERTSEYNLGLIQMSKTYISLSAIDTGGTNQSGGTTGREHSSAYSSAYS